MELDHVGVAVADLARASEAWRPLLGPADGPPEEVPSQGVTVAFFAGGSVHVELLEPRSPQSAVGRFLERRGEGLHHLAFRVPNVDRQLAQLVQLGQKVVDTVGRTGARGRRVGFAHPASFGGVLVEFVEAP